MEDVEPQENTSSSQANSLQARSVHAPIPFEDLDAPKPANPTPPVAARFGGLAAVAICGLLGGMIGFGTGDLLSESSTGAYVGMFVGALIAAIGVGTIVALTLRAMNEWTSISHPEAKAPDVEA